MVGAAVNWPAPSAFSTAGVQVRYAHHGRRGIRRLHHPGLPVLVGLEKSNNIPGKIRL